MTADGNARTTPGPDRPAPVRVMHFVNGLGLGGTEKTMQLFVRDLDRTRFDPLVFSHSDGERAELLRDLGIPVVIQPDPMRALARFRPHIAHIHRSGARAREPLRSIAVSGVPVIVETNVFGKYDPSELGRRFQGRFFVSDFCLRRYTEFLGLDAPPAECRVIYNPIDTRALAACGRERDFTRPVAGRVSRPDERKWSRLAYDILPLLVRDFPDFRYQIVGATTGFREFVSASGLDAHVDLRPLLRTDQELAAFLDGLSVFAHANDTGESFGMVIAEAMAAGLPVVTHPAAADMDNAQLELVEHGRTGLVAASAEEYAQAVAWLFRHPDRARDMGLAGRDKARRLYDVRVVTAQLEAAYLELLAAAGVRP